MLTYAGGRCGGGAPHLLLAGRGICTSILHISRPISIICRSLLQKRLTNSLGSFVCAPQLYYLQLYFSQLYCICVLCLFYLLYLLYLRYFALLALLAFWARWLLCRVLVCRMCVCGIEERSD
jgi:hypothetical protein